ncbi:MAG: inositol monophosphatase family protein [Acidimicrobiales bacterium]
MALGSVTHRLTPRLATIEDREAIVSLLESMGGHDDLGSRPDLAWVLGSVLEGSETRAVVAYLGSRLVGYVEIHARPSTLHAVREAWVGALVVDPDHRGEGIGEALLVAVDREAARLGCDRLVLESSTWRADAQRFYAAQGFVEGSPPAVRLARPVQEPLHDGLVTRFLGAAARAGSAARGAIAGLRANPDRGVGADGATTLAADRAAEDAVVEQLEPLGLAVISEESGSLVRTWSPEEPWICLDPLDGSRNYRHGNPPWATSIGLVLGGQPIAGLVVDHTSGRRWWASTGSGAWVDGRRAHPSPGGLLAVPSAGALEARRLRVPQGFERVRMSGSTSIDLCRVADGSLGGFVDLHRGVTHPHDLAAALVILHEAGAAIVRLDAEPLTIEPDPTVTMHLVVAADEATLGVLLGEA